MAKLVVSGVDTTGDHSEIVKKLVDRGQLPQGAKVAKVIVEHQIEGAVEVDVDGELPKHHNAPGQRRNAEKVEGEKPAHPPRPVHPAHNRAHTPAVAKAPTVAQ